MTAQALCEATSINIGDNSRDVEAIPDQNEILRSCSSLIRMSLDGERFEFAHFTVAEFLKSIDDSSNGEFAAYQIQSDYVLTGLAKVCFTYLNLQDFDQYGTSGYNITMDRFDRYPFRRHLTTSWLYYANAADWEDRQLFLLATQLYHPSKRGTLITWIDDRIWGPGFINNQHAEIFLAEATTLHIASVDGLFEVCQWLVENHCDVNRNTILGTPLHIALSPYYPLSRVYPARRNNRIRTERLPHVLLEAGADPNIAFGNCSPLYLALEGGSRRSVRHLLQKGAIVDDLVMNKVLNELDEKIKFPEDTDAQYAILHARKLDLSEKTRARALHYSLRGQASNISALLPTAKRPTSGIKSSKRDDEAHLHTAAEYGLIEEVIRLLDHLHIDVNAVEDVTLLTALHFASKRDQIEVAQLLMGRGADSRKADSKGRTALHHSVEMGIHCLDFYLQQNIDTTITDNEHLTVWHLAVLNKNLGALRILLDRSDSEILSIPLQKSRGLSLISCASKGSSIEAVSLLLDAGCSTSDLDSEGCTPLHHAAREGSPEITRLLIARGADARAMTDDGSSVMHCAMMSHRSELNEILDILLSTEVDPFKARHDGITPMELLISEGFHDSDEWAREKVLRRLASVAQSSEEKRGSLKQALSLCCEVKPYQRPEWLLSAFKVLLENGVDLMSKSSEGKSALRSLLDTWRDKCLTRNTPIKEKIAHSRLVAVATNMVLAALEHIPPEGLSHDLCTVSSLLRPALAVRNDDLILKLLDYSPDVGKSCDDSDDSPIRYACRNGCSRSVLQKLLARSKASFDAAFGSDLVRETCRSLSMDSNAILLELFRSGLDCNGHSPNGETALMYAAWAGNIDTVNTLLAHGSDAKARDHNGQTVGHYAFNSWNLEVLHVLRHLTDWNETANCVIRGSSFRNVTVLHLAATHDGISMLSFLLDEDLIKDIDGVTEANESALHLAAWVGRPRNVSLLISKKADPTLMTTSGQSPLHMAAKFGFVNVMKEFMNTGCNLRIPDSDGLDCEMLAWKFGHSRLATMIRRHLSERTSSR